MFKLTPREKKLLYLLLCLLLLGLVLRLTLKGPGSDPITKIAATDDQGVAPEGETVKETSETETGVIIVHVTGAVKNSGVYTLPEGSRVFHAVDEAGGALEDADLERINLAQPLYDGQPVFVPRKGDDSLSGPEGLISSPGEFAAAGGQKININTANKSQLETLPGIGNVKAQSIISHREKNGPFRSIEELLNVNGIGEKTLDVIRELVTVY